MIIRFTLNGRPVAPDLSPELRLLDVLRRNFGLTSVKCGCRTGNCGACSVLMEGSLVPACLMPMFIVKEKTVLTLEGFSGYREYREISDGFAEAEYHPCGYCRPGKILGTYDLLNANPQPDEGEILQALGGHQCRCNEYTSLVRAVTLISLKYGRRSV